MPIYPDKKFEILEQLRKISYGERVKAIEIGQLTQKQHEQVNNYRSNFGLPPLESPKIVYVGRHHYKSRVNDGYTIEDMYHQLEHGLHENAIISASHSMTCLQNHSQRYDGYGNYVRDKLVLELTTHKPRAEAFSVIPKGDKNKPPKK